MIVAGLGIGPLPLHVAAEDVRAGRLWRLPPYKAPPAIDVHLVTSPRARANRAEAAFLETLRACLAASESTEAALRVAQAEALGPTIFTNPAR